MRVTEVSGRDTLRRELPVSVRQLQMKYTTSHPLKSIPTIAFHDYSDMQRDDNPLKEASVDWETIKRQSVVY